MSLFVILMLLFTAVTGDDTTSLTVRRGDDVTLPCGNVIQDQQNCDSTSWLFSHAGETVVELVTDGNIRKDEKAKAKAKRLNVAEDCSLVIKNVKRDDVGRYSCRQFRSEHVPDARVLLNVIDITSNHSIRFNCQVFRYGDCAHTVQWYYKGDETDISEHLQNPCSATVTFTTQVEKSKIKDLLFCNVTDKSGQTLMCNEFSCEETEKESSSTEGGEPNEDDTPAAVTGQDVPSFTVRAGDNVTLPCGKVTENQNCDQISWLSSRGSTTAKLVTNGNINTNEVAKAERLNVAEDCSLVIKNVTSQDVGLYTCRQFRSGEQHGPDADVSLSVINMESHGPTFFICSVLTHTGCWHSVQWLYEGHKDTETSRGTCSADVTLTSPHPDQKSNLDESLYCKVTDNKSGNNLMLTLRHQSSHEAGKEGTSSEGKTPPEWWIFVIVAAGLAAFLVIIVAFIRWKKTKGSRTRRDENIRQSLNPAETQKPETSPDREDPEEGVAYASVSYTKNCNSKAKADGGDEDDAVTYSTLKVSSPAAEASVDASDLYATVNNTNNGETPG